MGGVVAKLAFIPPEPIPIQTKGALSYITTEHYTIPVLYLRGQKQPPDQVIIFSHGNAEDLGGVEGWLHEITNICDADVVGYDYPGYGLSSSISGAKLIEPSEKAAYEAINGVYDYLTKDLNPPIPPNKIILFGRSLGTGPTVDLASRKHDIKGVILQSPLLSAIRVVMRTLGTLPFDIFANIDKIHKVKVPVFICHGDHDEVINVSHGRKLADMLPNKSFPPLILEGAGHNDIESNYYFRYLRHLRDFITCVNAPPKVEEEKESGKGKGKKTKRKEGKAFV
eukprot:Phypoly_transcript_14472.p1 GENE.Phypoly_transcript_14472~~Phypoly_transcript_14472.p1  ORF type:complete len:282 (+),score=37.28 Phypoly_transcript_14472:53-898(+)